MVQTFLSVRAIVIAVFVVVIVLYSHVVQPSSLFKASHLPFLQPPSLQLFHETWLLSVDHEFITEKCASLCFLAYSQRIILFTDNYGPSFPSLPFVLHQGPPNPTKVQNIKQGTILVKTHGG